MEFHTYENGKVVELDPKEQYGDLVSMLET